MAGPSGTVTGENPMGTRWKNKRHGGKERERVRLYLSWGCVNTECLSHIDSNNHKVPSCFLMCCVFYRWIPCYKLSTPNEPLLIATLLPHRIVKLGYLAMALLSWCCLCLYNTGRFLADCFLFVLLCVFVASLRCNRSNTFGHQRALLYGKNGNIHHYPSFASFP